MRNTIVGPVVMMTGPCFPFLLLVLFLMGCDVLDLTRRGGAGDLCFTSDTCLPPYECVDGRCLSPAQDDDLLGLADEETDDLFNDEEVADKPDDTDDASSGIDADEVPDEQNEEDDPETDLLDDEADVTADAADLPDDDAPADEDVVPVDEDNAPPDECVTLNDPCDDGGDTGAVCSDTVAGYDCACSFNYTFNGAFCLADTRSDQPCAGLPANASWNTVSSITQTWNGSSWQPSTAGVHNQNPSVTECRFICVTDFHWDGGACISDTRTFTCAEKPENSEWNTVSSYQQTWNGSVWTPSDSATSYSLTGSTTSCRYKCAAGSAWTGSACVASSCGVNFPNTFGGLCWSEPTGLSTTWGDAGTHCSSIGGRRPTISELRKLITNCPATQTGGSCGVTDSCLSSTCWSSNCESCADMGDGRYSVFGDRTWLWSSQELLSYTANAWYVNFKSGRVYNGEKNYTPANYDVRCVQ